jgi:hypothetical protein
MGKRIGKGATPVENDITPKESSNSGLPQGLVKKVAKINVAKAAEQ